MADESSKAAEQAFGVIPNAYFDLIARVIPGCVFLFAINRVSQKNIVSVLIDTFIPYGELRSSTTAWLLVILFAAYVLGHALSPMVRFLEEGPKWSKTIRESCKSAGKTKRRYRLLPPFWWCQVASEDGRNQLQKRYNTLRGRSSSLASLAIRIRAEYTMYGGFAAALTIVLLVGFVRLVVHGVEGTLCAWLEGVTVDNWMLFAAGVIGIPVMLYRHLHTWDRFRKTVDQLLEASGGIPVSSQTTPS